MTISGLDEIIGLLPIIVMTEAITKFRKTRTLECLKNLNQLLRLGNCLFFSHIKWDVNIESEHYSSSFLELRYITINPTITNV
jgi:hypothetical protein